MTFPIPCRGRQRLRPNAARQCESFGRSGRVIDFAAPALWSLIYLFWWSCGCAYCVVRVSPSLECYRWEERRGRELRGLLFGWKVWGSGLNPEEEEDSSSNRNRGTGGGTLDCPTIPTYKHHHTPHGRYIITFLILVLFLKWSWYTEEFYVWGKFPFVTPALQVIQDRLYCCTIAILVKVKFFLINQQSTKKLETVIIVNLMQIGYTCV